MTLVVRSAATRQPPRHGASIEIPKSRKRDPALSRRGLAENATDASLYGARAPSGRSGLANSFRAYNLIRIPKLLTA